MDKIIKFIEDNILFEFDKNSPVANAYNNLAKEVLDNERTRQKDGTSKVR